MQVEIISPSKQIFKGEAEMVEMPSEKGRFQVLNNHAPLMTSLAKGTITLSSEGKIFAQVSIISGFAEVKNNIITALVVQE
jgi:F-type H+-transporting ATPase subunit epsilon